VERSRKKRIGTIVIDVISGKLDEKQKLVKGVTSCKKKQAKKDTRSGNRQRKRRMPQTTRPN